MGRRGPKPSGHGESGLISEILAYLTKHHEKQFTGPQIAEALSTGSPSVGMFLVRLHRAKKIRKIAQGIYQGVETERPAPKTVREHLEDGTLGPLRTRAEIEREEQLVARIEELEAALKWIVGVTDSNQIAKRCLDALHIE